MSTLTLENIRDKWAAVNQFDTGATVPESAQDVIAKVLKNAENLKAAKASTPAVSGASSGSSSGMKSEKIFNMMSVYLARGEGKA